MKPIKQLLESVRSQAPVVGLTHGFYRYPARFSPQFARSVIEAFTQPMDTVMDPFMGGGTAAVEALGLGRRFVGSDLNSLSVFVTRIKTTPLSTQDEEEVLGWIAHLTNNGSIRTSDIELSDWTAYHVNTPWWIRKAIDMALRTTSSLGNARQKDFARSIVLKTAQWALDCKEKIPSSAQSFAMMATNAGQMLGSIRDFRERLRDAFREPPSKSVRFRRLMHRDAAAIAEKKVFLLIGYLRNLYLRHLPSVTV